MYLETLVDVNSMKADTFDIVAESTRLMIQQEQIWNTIMEDATALTIAPPPHKRAGVWLDDTEYGPTSSEDAEPPKQKTSPEDKAKEKSRIAAFFDKVKEFFINLIKKMKQLWNKFLEKIQPIIKAMREALTKYIAVYRYRKATKGKLLFNGYKFTHLDWKPPGIDSSEFLHRKINDRMVKQAGEEGNRTALDKLLEEAKETNYQEVASVCRMKSLYANKPIEFEDFENEIKKYFRDGKDTPEAITYPDVPTILNYLKMSCDSDLLFAKDAYFKFDQQANNSTLTIIKLRDEAAHYIDLEQAQDINRDMITILNSDLHKLKLQVISNRYVFDGLVHALNSKVKQNNYMIRYIMGKSDEKTFDEGYLSNGQKYISDINFI